MEWNQFSAERLLLKKNKARQTAYRRTTDCFADLVYIFGINFQLISKYERKGRDLTQAHDKSPYTNINVKRAKWQQKNATKKFDYSAIADQLRIVS